MQADTKYMAASHVQLWDVTNTHDCWPRVSVNMCWFSTTLLNTRNVKDVGFDELVALRGRCSLNFNRYACGLGRIQSNMPPGPLEIKEKSYLTDAPPSNMPTNNVRLYQPRLLHCQYNVGKGANIHAM